MSEALIHLRDLGIHKMEHQKWAKAENIFTKVIDQVGIANDEEANLKCYSLLQRALCRLFLDKKEEAREDSNEVISIYKTMRPNNDFLDPDFHPPADDPLTPIISNAFLRRGQVFELNSKLLDALKEYKISSRLNPNAEGEAAIARLFNDINLPVILTDEEGLEAFAPIPINILDIDKLNECLDAALKHLMESDITQPIIAKINSKGICRIFYATIQLYISNSSIVSKCIHALTIFAAKGVGDVWSGYIILHYALINFKTDKTIFIQLITLLQLVPPELFQQMTECDFVTPLIEGFSFDLTDSEIQTIFYLVYQLITNEELLLKSYDMGIIKQCFMHKSKGSLLLLSKICAIPIACKDAVDNGVLDWCIDELNVKDNDPNNLRAPMLLITRYLLTVPLPSECDDQKPPAEIVEFTQKVFDIVMSNVVSNSKSSEIVSCAFGILALCVPFSVESVGKNKAVRAASVMLAIYCNDISVATNIVTFLYEALKYGCKEQIKSDVAVVKTVAKAIAENPESQLLVERGVIIAYECGHSNGKVMLQAAVKQFPTSDVLRKYVEKVGKELLK
ncbi:hypothetical protein GPJ56_001963 [Histomonas meleagridis]|uniref:uncharacterized protein n=1 Tax=Histomonas meleagridis TaxID=135588 RepID=UPI003559694F|nr:hypothetical protein GPJ56_001963 [Histomonas meleagridis]KAH0800961.1 hypothetical protein GO595_006277 [Histomonas meleagridis]